MIHPSVVDFLVTGLNELRKEQNRVWNAAYRAKHAERVRVRSREWGAKDRKENPERYLPKRAAAVAKTLAWRAANLERDKAARKARWAAKSQEERDAICKAQYHSNREVKLRKAKEYRLRNPAAAKAQAAAYRAANVEAIREGKRKCYEAKREQYLAKTKENKRERMRGDVSFRLLERLRGRVSSVMRAAGVGKTQSFRSLVGCSGPELRAHLESKFTQGMTWDEYGFHGWHVDHIRPCASFDLTDEAQQRECFHYTNLQPMWGVENMRKNAKTA